MHFIYEMRCDKEQADKQERRKKIAAVKSVAEDMGLGFTERTGIEDEAAIQVSLPFTIDTIKEQTTRLGDRLAKAGDVLPWDFNSLTVVLDNGMEYKMPLEDLLETV